MYSSDDEYGYYHDYDVSHTAYECPPRHRGRGRGRGQGRERGQQQQQQQQRNAPQHREPTKRGRDDGDDAPAEAPRAPFLPLMYPQGTSAGYDPFLKPKEPVYCDTAAALQAAMYTGNTKVTAIRFWPGTAGGARFLTDVAQKMPWITALDFSNINVKGAAPTFIVEDFLAVAHLFPRLTSLDFSRRYGPDVECGVKLTTPTLIVILRRLPLLNRLSFFGQSLRSEALEHIAQACPLLQHLDFGCGSFSPADIIECARRCKYLELLDLRQTAFIKRDLMTLLALLPRLRFVDCRETRIQDVQIFDRDVSSHPNILLDF